MISSRKPLNIDLKNTQVTEEKLRNNEPQGRLLTIDLFDTQHQTWVPTDFYPLVASRLGFDYAIYGPMHRRCGTYRWGTFFSEYEVLEAYVNQKTACMQTFVPHPSQNVRRRGTSCSVM